MDINVLRGLITIGLIVAFVSICIYAWSSRNRQRFDQTARQILDDADETSTLRAAQQTGPSRSPAPDLQHKPNAG